MAHCQVKTVFRMIWCSTNIVKIEIKMKNKPFLSSSSIPISPPLILSCYTAVITHHKILDHRTTRMSLPQSRKIGLIQKDTHSMHAELLADCRYCSAGTSPCHSFIFFIDIHYHSSQACTVVLVLLSYCINSPFSLLYLQSDNRFLIID